MTILLIILILILIGMGIGVIYLIKDNKFAKERIYELRKKFDIYKASQEKSLQSTRELNTDLSNQIIILSDRLNSAQQNQLSDQEIINRKETIDRLIQEINNKENEYKVISLNCLAAQKAYQEKQDELNGKLNFAQEERVKVANELNALQTAIFAATSENESLVKDVENSKKLLSELQNRYKVAIIDSKKEENNFGIRFMINNKEQSLLNAIHTIVDNYPDLTRDLLKIEWEKVWRPKLQVYRSELNEKSGIYKLTLVEDTDICYIGQAKNIYDRWFQHMKKMIGVEPKGNEKLYEYGIGDFYWKVQEEVDGDLNDAEKYWIDYFACTEVGLNKKR